MWCVVPKPKDASESFLWFGILTVLGFKYVDALASRTRLAGVGTADDRVRVLKSVSWSPKSTEVKATSNPSHQWSKPAKKTQNTV